MLEFDNELEEHLRFDVMKAILEEIVRCLPSVTAHRLIGHLANQQLQDELLELAPGPNSSIDLSSILDKLIARFGLTEDAAQSALVHVCIELTKLLSPREMKQIRSGLPEDLKLLFAEKKAA